MPFNVFLLGYRIMLAQEIIKKKRDGENLTAKEIKTFVQGVLDWSVSDGQLSALLMAFLINGMSHEELQNWISEIIDSGMVLDWDSVDLNGPVASIHTMPSVGDKSEIIVGAVLASAGMYVPMLCDKMQYHTGGTIDKLSSISGYDINPSKARFRKTLLNSGFAFLTSSEQLAPADVRIQSIRDTTATISSIDLLIASLLIKKVASGVKKLTVDIKTGSASFTTTEEYAKEFEEKLLLNAAPFGLDVKTIFSNVNEVVGQNIGNSLEIYEVWAFLTGALGNRDKQLMKQTKTIASVALVQNGICSNEENAKQLVEDLITSGKAAEQFSRMLYEMGVSQAFMSNPMTYLPQAPVVLPVYAGKTGIVETMNMRWIGLSVIEMGAGRLYSEQKIDLSAGYSNMIKPGTKVMPDTVLAFIHAQDEQTALAAQTHLLGAINING
ncbi:MAG: thymidine phosphorylase [Alphaproteobacteria bacterium]|nr:thymidine phosphorylase [Alphaproteobacteria bacterium]